MNPLNKSVREGLVLHCDRQEATRPQVLRRGVKIIAAALGLVLASISVTACGQTETIKWQEEVALHDGNTIVVTRTITLGGVRREIGQGAGVSNYTLSFTSPDGKQITWENPGHLIPLIVDFDNGVPFIATEPAMVIDFDRYQCPKPGYVFFKYAGAWKRIEYRDFPETLQKTNLLVNTKGHRDRLRGGDSLRSPEISALNSSLDRKLKAIDPDSRSPGGCGNSSVW